MQTQRIHSLFLALFFSMASLAMISTMSISYFDDVEIYVNETAFKCDKIFCPEDADRCHVSKEKSSDNDTELVRTNRCYSKDNKVLSEHISREPIGYNRQISLYVDSYRDGRTNSFSGSVFSSNSDFDAEKLDKELQLHFGNIDKIHQNVEENVRAINEHVEKQLQDIHHQLENLFPHNF